MPANNRPKQSRDRQPTPRKFWIHFAIFVVVNAGLITLNLVRSPDKYWFHWVLLGWGAGVLLNAYRVFGCCCTKQCAVKSPMELPVLHPESMPESSRWSPTGAAPVTERE